MPRYAVTADVPLATPADTPDSTPVERFDPAQPTHALKAGLAGVDAVAIGHDAGPAAVRAVLDAAADAGVPHVVVISSATVYGAWPDNPVPLSEDASLRPNPGFAFAAERAESERLAAEWKDAHPGATATVLRPAIIMRGTQSPFERALSGTAGLRSREASRPMQFLAEDDLARAVALALATRLDGVYNVAPDGWVPDETARALAGGPARIAVPERLARPFRALARTWPGLDPYTRHPWVVANDRLKAAGWSPTHSNEEAFVESGANRWPELSPKRKQEVALAGSAGVLGGVAALVVWLVRRSRRAKR
jgi:nucleoside-diphosphate-sugar epimerase